MKKKKKRSPLASIAIALIFLVGLGVLLYPAFSDLWNQRRQDRLIGSYLARVESLNPVDHAAELAAAREYNAALRPDFHDAFTGELPPETDLYWSLLDPDGSGVMGYLEIPKIAVRLPVYHGTGEDVLQQGVGHLAGTSLPVGGAGTHSVLSGHRGLPSALLLTDLDRLEVGDKFCLYILGERLTYAVDNIAVVEPDRVDSLLPAGDGDYVTLLTCTPYGVNTHRLLVRGARCADEPEETVQQVSTAQQIVRSLGWKGKLAYALWALAAAAALALAWVLAGVIRRKKRKGGRPGHDTPPEKSDYASRGAAGGAAPPAPDAGARAPGPGDAVQSGADGEA